MPLCWEHPGKSRSSFKQQRAEWCLGEVELPRIMWERRSCSSAAARMLETGYPPSESPATAHQCCLFLPEAAFQGKIALTGLEMSQLNGSVKSYWFVKTNTPRGDLLVQTQLLGTVMRKLWRNKGIWFNSSIWNVSTFLFQNKFASFFFLFFSSL